MAYKRGDVVWLKEFHEELIHEPRQRALILGSEINGTIQVELVGEPIRSNDDQLREVPVEQIDGLALTANDYRLAIQVQDASNLSGVLYSYAEAMHKIRREDGVDSHNSARHPISIMFLDKLVSLAGGTVRWLEDDDTYGKALTSCRSEEVKWEIENISKS